MTVRPRHVSEPLARVIGHIVFQQKTEKDRAHAVKFLRDVREHAAKKGAIHE
jgi:hypothetical protein